MATSGKRVLVMAPAGPFHAERCAAGMAWLEGQGFRVRFSRPGGGRPVRYLGGTDEERLADLHAGLGVGSTEDEGCDIAWYARGGYGTARLLTDLTSPTTSEQRIIVGFSDATVLLNALARERATRGHGAIAVHGPVVQTLAAPELHGSAPGVVCIDEDSRNTLLRLLVDGSATDFAVTHLCGPTRSVQAPVLGGNLTLLASACGTPWQVDARGHILLIEEVGEAPYRIDRMVRQLQQAGSLAGVVGVVLGEFIACEPAAPSWTLRDVLIDVLEPLGVPVWHGAPVGHGARNGAWIVGADATLGEGWLAWGGGSRDAGAGRDAGACARLPGGR